MDIFLLLVICLFVLACLDLMVGVSNDAVNFLNSAIGSKVASVRVILIVATLGILIGSVFSSGIMEVARKGIFNPEFFTFEVVMLLFLAVMVTDIILLDLFNTLGMPTSTTVSIVFELLGAASMMALLHSIDIGESLGEFPKYINTKSAVTIIAGIFLSVFIAFIVGAIAQFISRMIFTFNYERNLERYGAIFGGVAIMAIGYFLILKGMKGTSMDSSAAFGWVTDNLLVLLGSLFLSATVVCFILQKVWHINPLNIIVLSGTFALAMAFAGNDLVNFIGVPVAAFMSYEYWLDLQLPPGELYMGYLGQKLHVPEYMLIIAGVIMAVTLWMSAKARKVTETEVNLGRQEEGLERFNPNLVSRTIVKSALRLGGLFSYFIPATVNSSLVRIFNGNTRDIQAIRGNASFDLIRASVNLVIASILIAYATSRKMPLSTTYVSFMVAMGTSLADRAWGRESAVYRVAGVLSVISGWFLTAIIAFCSAAVMALLLYYFRTPAVIALMLVAGGMLVASQRRFKKRQQADLERAESVRWTDNPQQLDLECRNMSVRLLGEITAVYTNSLDGLLSDSRVHLRTTQDRMESITRQTLSMRSGVMNYLKKQGPEYQEIGKKFIVTSDHLTDIVQSVSFIAEQCREYVENLHTPVGDEVGGHIRKLREIMPLFIREACELILEPDAEKKKELVLKRNELRGYIDQVMDMHLEGMNRFDIGIRQALLQSEILLQSRDILSLCVRLVKLNSTPSESSGG